MCQAGGCWCCDGWMNPLKCSGFSPQLLEAPGWVLLCAAGRGQPPVPACSVQQQPGHLLAFSCTGTQTASPAEPPALVFALCLVSVPGYPCCSLSLSFLSDVLHLVQPCLQAQEGTSQCLLMLQGVGSSTGAPQRAVLVRSPAGKCPLVLGQWQPQSYKLLRQWKCAKLSWWHSTDLIFGMISPELQRSLHLICFSFVFYIGEPHSLEKYSACGYYKELQLVSCVMGRGVRRRDAWTCTGTANWVHSCNSFTPRPVQSHLKLFCAASTRKLPAQENLCGETAQCFTGNKKLQIDLANASSSCWHLQH